MPIRNKQFINIYDKMVDIIDVDDSRGRSVPTNMNFIEEGFLSKDTGSTYFGTTDASTESHSLFNYEKKDGTTFKIRAKGTKLQYHNGTDFADITGSPTFTAGAKFGYVVYDDELYFGNAVESLYKFDGTTFTEYASAPKGNILEIFEDRLFVAGVTAEPLTVYYSGVGTPTTFAGSDVLNPLGTDKVTGLVNYYGTLLIFKRDSIWKLTFVYDQVVTDFIPKLESQSRNYGACNRKCYGWVENDIWFFTGREVRSIGFKDQQIGILGVNVSVISEPIKETIYTLPVANYEVPVTFYHNRRFYLALPLENSAYNNTIFVCHTLHKNSWTKYSDRIKATTQDFMEIDGVVYTAKSATPFGVLQWDEAELNDNDAAITATVRFNRFEDKDFNTFKLYRYLDLMFKDLDARVTVTLIEDANDSRSETSKEFIIGATDVSDDMMLGQVPVGAAQYGDSYGYVVPTNPFQKRRISFLSKSQSLSIELSNGYASETFTVSQLALSGDHKPRKLFKSSNIVSVG